MERFPGSDPSVAAEVHSGWKDVGEIQQNRRYGVLTAWGPSGQFS